MLLIDYLGDRKRPVAHLMHLLREADPDREISRETVRHWVQNAKENKDVIIKFNRGKPYWIGREVRYWSL